MDFLEYQINARRTAKDECKIEKLSHALEGLISEVGEIADAIKKYKRYGQALDSENIREEVGDVLWYLAMLCDAVSASLEVCASDNIAKLKRRYPDKFTEDHAAARADKALVPSGAEA